MAGLSLSTSLEARGTLRSGRQYRWLPLWLLLPSLLVLLLLQVGPTLYSVYLSTTRVRAGAVQDVGLRNFERLLASRSFQESLQVTVTYTAFYVVLTMLLGLVIALLLNRRVRFTGFYLVLIFLPWVISDVVVGTMWRWLFQPTYGLLQHWLVPFAGDSIYTSPTGALAIVIGAAVWRGLAFTTLLSLGALQTVPNEILESAALDGANRFQRFFFIIFPLTRPMVVVLLLLTSIQAINSVGLIFAITRGGPGGATRTVAYFLLQIGWEQGDFGTGAAISVIMFVINLLLTLFYLRMIGRKAA